MNSRGTTPHRVAINRSEIRQFQDALGRRLTSLLKRHCPCKPLQSPAGRPLTRDEFGRSKRTAMPVSHAATRRRDGPAETTHEREENAPSLGNRSMARKVVSGALHRREALRKRATH